MTKVSRLAGFMASLLVLGPGLLRALTIRSLVFQLLRLLVISVSVNPLPIR